MKRIYHVMMVTALLICQVAFSQTATDKILEPAIKVKQQLQSYGVALPYLRPVVMLTPPGKGADIKKAAIAKNMELAKKSMETARQQCPYLKFKPTLELMGERVSNEKVGLKWVTTNGFDNRAFDVTRSLGDTLHFENVNFVWADAGQGVKEKYHLPDDNDFNETSYYRLRLQLTDGSVVYSNIAAVKGYNNILFALYPNPVMNKLQINLSSKERGSAVISIYDATGKKVQQQSSTVVKGNGLAEINVSGLPAGAYTIKMSLPGSEIRTGKFVKD